MSDDAPTRVPVKERENIFNYVRPSPRVKLAAALYGSGVARTKKEAAQAAGLHPQYLSLLRNNPEVNQIIGEAERAVRFKTEDISTLLQRLGRESLMTIDEIRTDPTAKAETRLKAAVDLADRSPETAKTQKHQVTSFSIDGEDAQAIIAALAESQQVQDQYAQEVQGNYVKVDLRDMEAKKDVRET